MDQPQLYWDTAQVNRKRTKLKMTEIQQLHTTSTLLPFLPVEIVLIVTIDGCFFEV